MCFQRQEVIVVEAPSNGGRRQAMVGELTPYTSYLVYVQPYTSLGSGVQSEHITVTTLEAGNSSYLGYFTHVVTCSMVFNTGIHCLETQKDFIKS